MTIEYYKNNAAEFVSGTVDVDMSETYGKFMSHVHTGHLLDLGCGSGRDSKFFMNQGYKITAIDAVPEMCHKASDFIGNEVLCLKFDELDYESKFDGIWACASLLHVPKADLPDIFSKCITALKPGGVLYMSFKFGDTERTDENGRFFNDQNESSLLQLLEAYQQVEVLEMWQTADKRQDRSNELWLNCLVRRGT